MGEIWTATVLRIAIGGGTTRHAHKTSHRSSIIIGRHRSAAIDAVARTEKLVVGEWVGGTCASFDRFSSATCRAAFNTDYFIDWGGGIAMFRWLLPSDLALKQSTTLRDKLTWFIYQFDINLWTQNWKKKNYRTLL